MEKGRKSARTKAALADALVGLAQEGPICKVTVGAVAKRAGVDRQTFYYHFETMDELVRFVSERWVSRLVEKASGPTELRQMFHVVVDFVVESKDLLLPLLEHLGRIPLREVFYGKVNGMFEKRGHELVAELGVSVSEQDLAFVLGYCQYASVFLILDVVTGNEVLPITASELADRLNDAFEQQIRGLCLKEQQIIP